MKQIDFSLEQLFNGIAMRKLLFIMVATLVSIQGKAQVFQLNATDFGITTNTPVAAEMQWADNTAVTLSNAFATNHDAYSCANDGYTKVLIDNNEIQTAGVHGYDNPKDADNNNPATTLNVPASGSVIQIEAKKNGWLYIVARLSSNKQYMVFEDGEAIGYKYALENLDSRVSNHVMTGEVGTAGSSLNRSVKSLICEYTGDSEAASAGDGLGVFYFPVKKGSSYYAHACGSKIFWCGAYFSKTEAEIVKVVKEDESELILVNQPSPNITFTDSNVKALCVANWDTNDDGELSEAEAAAVTDLGEVFKNNTSITSFNELQYFIGLENIGDFAFYSCSGLTSITIPNSVTSIDNDAFAGCSGLTSVTIPNSITSIGYSAFYECDGLTSVTIGNSVNSIGVGAFGSCFALTSVHISDIEAWCRIDFGRDSSNPLSYALHLYLDEEEITDLVIPSTITTIGAYAFYNCKGLTSVTIGNGVTSIGESAFRNCSDLTSISIPNSVTSIGSSAFQSTGLTSITIPNSVTSIGNLAFLYCNALTSVHISDLDAWCRIAFNDYDSNPLYYAHHLYLDEEEITELVIPSTVTSIRPYAFYYCSGLTSVTIGNNVTSIGDAAFGMCSGLTSVTIDNSVTSIGNSAFYRCSGLTSVTIGNSVTSIGENAFSYCDGLTSVTIPNSVTSIGYSAFYECDGLTSVTIGNSVNSIGVGAFGSCFALTSVHISDIEAWCRIDFGRDSSNPLSYALHLYLDEEEITDLVIPSTITTIGAYAFYNCKGLTSVTIGNNVTSIGNYAFYGCSGLSSVTIPNSVTSIGDYAFQGCSGLTSVTIPNSVTSIGASAFNVCSGLTSITIPSSVTSIGNYAFADCSSLTVVVVDKETPLSISSKVFIFTNLYNATLVVPIGSRNDYLNASYWNDFGTIMEMAGEGGYTYTDSNGLTWYCYLYNGHVILEDYTVDLEEDDPLPCVKGSIPSNLIIPSTVKIRYVDYPVTVLGKNSFYNMTALTSITIPNSVTTIEWGAFNGCDALSSVHISDLDAWCRIAFNDFNSNPLYYAHHLYLNEEEITELVIPSTVTIIRPYTFRGCSGLTSVTIPNSVTYIGNNAFNNCNNLTSVHISDLDAWCRIAFNYYDSNPLYYAHHLYLDEEEITELVIPSTVTNIDANAFAYCDGLTSVTIPNSVTSIGGSAFSGCSGLSSITVAQGNTKYDSRDNCNAIIESASNTLIAGCKTTIIPNGVTSIGSYAFSRRSGLTSITIPNSVTSIGSAAFQNCSGLTSVNSQIETPFAFGSSAFYGITNDCVLTVPYGTRDAYIAAGWTTSVFKGGVVELENVTIAMKTGSGADRTMIGYSSQYSLDFTGINDVRAYIAIGFTDTKNVLMARVNIVPANTGIVLKSDVAGVEVEVPITTSDVYYANLLKPAVNNVTIYPTEDIDAVNYTNLMVGKLANEQMGFVTLPSSKAYSNKSYLQIPTEFYNGAASAREGGLEMEFVDTETTDIRSLMHNGSATNDAYYDLQGRKVTPVKKGIYIKNGKKVIVK